VPGGGEGKDGPRMTKKIPGGEGQLPPLPPTFRAYEFCQITDNKLAINWENFAQVRLQLKSAFR